MSKCVLLAGIASALLLVTPDNLEARSHRRHASWSVSIDVGQEVPVRRSRYHRRYPRRSRYSHCHIDRRAPVYVRPARSRCEVIEEDYYYSDCADRHCHCCDEEQVVVIERYPSYPDDDSCHCPDCCGY